MTRDGNNLLTLDYDVTGVWDPDWGGQWSGETFHQTTDVPGTAGDETTFNYIQRYMSNGDINFVSTLDPVNCCDRYHRDISDASVGGKRLDIWTNPL